MFTIGAFSELGHVSIKALRFYDELGLLKPTHVDGDSGYRYYAAKLLPRLNRILFFKELGFSLEEIGQLLKGDLPLSTVCQMLRQQLETSKQRVHQEQKRLAQVQTWLAQFEREGRLPDYEITIKEVAPRWVASVRNSLNSYADAGHLFAELDDYLQRRSATGQHGAIWHACTGRDQTIDCEALIFLREPVAGSNQVRVYELPAACAACVIHQGSDEACAQAYVAARRWIECQGHTMAGPNRELYWHDGHEQDGDSSVTEIQFPIFASPQAVSQFAN
jgi:DNA-binding transcriptional MerR regulator